MDRSLGRVVRALRLRLGWRQVDLARRAGQSRRAVSKLEREGPAGFTDRTLRRICEPLEIDLLVFGRWRGGELDRLLDAGHATLQTLFKSRLEAAGWIVQAEATFSRYGERGSIDLPWVRSDDADAAGRGDQDCDRRHPGIASAARRQSAARTRHRPRPRLDGTGRRAGPRRGGGIDRSTAHRRARCAIQPILGPWMGGQSVAGRAGRQPGRPPAVRGSVRWHWWCR